MNSVHPIVFELSKLKESSKEAVADASSKNEDAFKLYLHIERQVELDLKNIILASANTSGSSLVLLCGNVGDGKSHLLSKLHQEPLIASCLGQFQMHNDATESFSPDQTCIDTLCHILEPFSDENLGKIDAKWILAINLGTLSNFLEERGDAFKKLRDFVDQQGVIDPEKFQLQDAFISGSYFQVVNFTNHHFYELTKAGVKPELFEKLFSKIVANDAKNPLYQAYQSLKKEEWTVNCPIVANYEFLADFSNIKTLSRLLVECILKEKVIISFRQILSFIYDLLIPYSLSGLSIEEHKKVVGQNSASARLDQHMINYIFENPQLSRIFTILNKLDPAIRRYERLDEKATTIYTSLDPLYLFNADFENLPIFLKRNLGAELSVIESRFKTYLRLNYFSSPGSDLYKDDYFDLFAQALYYYNTKDAPGLREINELVKAAVLIWNGSTLEKDKIMFPNISKHSNYRLFRTLNPKPILPAISEKIAKDKLHQFLTEVKVSFFGTDAGKNVAFVNVDYSLYMLLQKVKQGYRPNKIDRSSFINFVSMVETLMLQDSNDDQIFVDEINFGRSLDYQLRLGDYGDFEFSKI